MRVYSTEIKDFPSIAACVDFFEGEGPLLRPSAFRPLAPITGGMNIMKMGELPFSMVVAANA